MSGLEEVGFGDVGGVRLVVHAEFVAHRVVIGVHLDPVARLARGLVVAGCPAAQLAAGSGHVRSPVGGGGGRPGGGVQYVATAQIAKHTEEMIQQVIATIFTVLFSVRARVRVVIASPGSVFVVSTHSIYRVGKLSQGEFWK